MVNTAVGIVQTASDCLGEHAGHVKISVRDHTATLAPKPVVKRTEQTKPTPQATIQAAN